MFKRNKPTTIKGLREVLVGEMGLKAGDRIIVSSSFGNLKVNYSPKEIVELLMAIVTDKGTIMMPFFTPNNSDIRGNAPRLFNMSETKSGVSEISYVFSKMPGVVRSIHPTKSVCIWGKDAEELANGHENAATPFSWDSPMGKLLKIGCKSIGLGVKNIPIFHVIEDILSDQITCNQPNKYRLHLIKGDIPEINDYASEGIVLDNYLPISDYVSSLKVKSFQIIKFGKTFIYSVDNTDLLRAVQGAYISGKTRCNNYAGEDKLVKRKNLIIIGLTPQGLSLLRTLSRLGCNVTAFYHDNKNIGVHSKYGEKIQFEDIYDLKEKIQLLIDDWGFSPICYITSGELLALVLREYKELYHQCVVLSGPYEVVEKLAHKDEMYELAKENGFNVADYITLDKYKEGYLSYPLFMKRNYEIPLFFKAVKLDNEAALKSYVSRIKEGEKKDIIIQQWIDIPKEHLINISGQSFYWEGISKGHLIVSQVRRLKKGITSYIEEVTDTELVGRISQLMDSFMFGLKYNGFAEFEFMYDNKTGALFFIEVNTRTCGLQSSFNQKFKNLGLAALCPASKVELISSEKPIRWMNILRDIRSRIETKDFRHLTDIFHCGFDVFDIHDLKPFIKQLL